MTIEEFFVDEYDVKPHIISCFNVKKPEDSPQVFTKEELISFTSAYIEKIIVLKLTDEALKKELERRENEKTNK